MSVYDKIVAQLPRGFSTMVGATQFVDLGNGLKFRFKGSKKANLVMITLTSRDTYTVEFFKMAKYDYEKVAIVEDVYGDQLARVFEHMTGLRLSLF